MNDIKSVGRYYKMETWQELKVTVKREGEELVTSFAS